MSTAIQDVATSAALLRRQSRKDRILGSSESRSEAILPGSSEEFQSSKEVPDFNDSQIEYVAPRYVDLCNRNRVAICMMIGVVLFLIASLGFLERIIIPCFLLSFAYNFYIQTNNPYPKHGYVVNFCLAFGSQHKLVSWIGFLTDTFFEVFRDVSIMSFGFIVAHIITYGVNLLF